MDPVEKPWYMSKGVFIGLAIAILGLLKIDMSDDLKTMLETNYDQIFTVVLGLGASYNRIQASRTVKTPSWLPGAPPPQLGNVANFLPPAQYVQVLPYPPQQPQAYYPPQQAAPPAYAPPMPTYGGPADEARG